MQTVTRNALSLATGLVVFAFLVLGAPLAHAQSVDVTIDDVQGEPGDTVDVAVDVGNLDNAADVTSYEFDMAFDTAVVSYVGFDTDGTLSDDAGFTVDDNKDVPRIGAFGSNALNDFGASGTLITLTFTIEGEGSTTVSLDGFTLNDGSPSSNPATPEFSVEASDLIVSAADVGPVSEGDTVTVPITTSDVSGQAVTSFEFDLSYDDAIVSPLDVSVDGTIADGYTADGNKLSGQATFRVGAFGSDSLSGSGTLANVRFTVVGPGTSDLTFDSFTFNDGTPAAITKDGSVEVRDILLGDITDNGSVSAYDANRVLLASLNLSPPRPLSERDSIAADVTKDGSISSGDASEILRLVVGKIDSFGSSKLLATGNATLEWGDVRSTDNGSVLPIEVTGNASSVYALQVTVEGDVGAINTSELRNQLPDGWQFVSRRNEGAGTFKMAMAGADPLNAAGEVIGLPISNSSPSLTATGQIGEAPTMALGKAGLSEAPGSFGLIGNYPNPVQGQTSIAFNLPEDAKVSVEVYDMLGRRVVTVPEQQMRAGERRTVRLNASDLSSGVYIYRVNASSAENTQWKESGRMVIAN